MGLKALKKQKHHCELRKEKQRGIEQEEGQDLECMVCHKDMGMNPQILMA